MRIDIPKALLEAVASNDDVIIYLNAFVPLECSLTTLKNCKAVKIILFNNADPKYVLNPSAAAAFDFALPFDGQKFNSALLGNPEQKLIDKTVSHVMNPAIQAVCEDLLTACLPVAKSRDRIFLVTNIEEYLYQIALIREKYGLKLGRSSSFSQLFIEKTKMKAEYQRLGIPTAPCIQVSLTTERLNQALDTVKEAITNGILQYPIFVKPASGCGSVQTGIIGNNFELKEWIKGHQQSPFVDFLFEDMLYPPIYNVQIAVTKQNEIYLISLEINEPGFADFVLKREPVSAVFSDGRKDKQQKEITSFALEAFTKLGVSKSPGIYFMELMRRKEGQLVVMEMAARNPLGVFNPSNVELITGFDVESYNMVWPFLENVTMEPVPLYPSKTCAGSIIYPCKSGILTKNQYPDSELLVGGSTIEHIIHYHKPGDTLTDSTSIIDISCELSFSASNEADLVETIHKLKTMFNPILLEVQD